MTAQGPRIDQELSFTWIATPKSHLHTHIKRTTFTYTTLYSTSTLHYKTAPQEGTAQLSSFRLIDQILEI